MKFIEYRGPFRYFNPQYDEIVLFTMSFTCILLLLTALFSYNYQEMEIPSLDSRVYNPRVIAAIVVFIAGLILSIYHAFIDRPKTNLEKSIMLFFAVLLNAFSGVMAGFYDYGNMSGWIVVFPVVNMVNSIVLIYMWRTGILGESSISDQHAPRSKILLAAATVLILFYLCQVVYRLIWIQTLSICLVYSLNFMRLLESLIFRPVPARDISHYGKSE